TSRCSDCYPKKTRCGSRTERCFYEFTEESLTMLAQEGRDFQMVLLHVDAGRAALRVERAAGTLAGRRHSRSPCPASLYGAAGGSVVGHRRARFLALASLLLADIEADIGGQALEQRAGIARLAVLPFLRFLCPACNNGQFLGARHAALPPGARSVRAHVNGRKPLLVRRL